MLMRLVLQYNKANRSCYTSGTESCVCHCCCWEGKTHTIRTHGSASGNVLPPIIIFPREHLSNKQVHGCVPGTLFACSSNGWIDQVLRIWQMVWFFYRQPASNSTSFAYWRWPLISYTYLFLWLKRLENVTFIYFVSQHIPHLCCNP